MRLRFPISPSDQLRAVAGSTVVTEIPGAPGPPGLPFPQSSRLTFEVLVIDTAPIPIRPLCAGTIEFIADPAAPGDIPAPEDVDFSGNAYLGWKTVGTLLFRPEAAAIRDIGRLTSDLAIVPTMLWYSKVRISKDFLQNSLPQLKADIIGMGVERTIKKNDLDWHQHAVSRFLGGRFDPKLKEGPAAADDDVEKLAMPFIEPDALTGSVELVVSAAAAARPYDGTPAQLDASAGAGISKTDPRHPANGAIPARHVYNSLRPFLIDAPGGVLPDAWLPQLPVGIRYFLFRFTRIWQPKDDCSIHFPGQRITINDGAGDVLNVPLPCHGRVFLFEDPMVPLGNVTVTVTGSMRSLLATTANIWREQATAAPIGIDLAVLPVPHIILRRTMAKEMLADTSRPKVKLPACTFYSFRRTLRALIDHRITGGRLNLVPAKTSPGTKKLMDDAGVSGNIVADNRPLPNVATKEEIQSRSHALRPILEAFFPNPAAAHMVDGSMGPADPMTKGQAAYYLWQSMSEVIKMNGKKRRFPDEDIGCGAPGALHFLGLASYVEPPAQLGPETDAAYRHRLASALSTRLEPGGLIQFWKLQSDFETIRDRTSPVIKAEDYGHSPVFEAYEDAGGRRRAMKIIDQTPPSIGLFVDVAGAEVDPAVAADLRIAWEKSPSEEFWVAANWTE